MSLIYYSRRAGLEDRVFRIRTGKAASTLPLPRTVHLISNVRIRSSEGDLVEAAANWVTHYHRNGIAGHFFGTADYTLRRHEGDWRILRKKVALLNDRINQVLDFYHV
jgi:anthranilate 1,2-dioxygenase (deaminating, decarboxylating) small subunit